MTRYWFARYRLKPRPGRGVVPVAWQGRAVIFGFVAALVLGGASFLLLALLAQEVFFGIALFVLLAVAGGGTFLWAAVARCDPELTAADYLAQKHRT